MRKRRFGFVVWVVVVITVYLVVHLVVMSRAQSAEVVILKDGEEVCVRCDCSVETATVEPTGTLVPTNTPGSPTATVTEEPTPTMTPIPGIVWQGVVRSPIGDWGMMSDQLGANVVEFLVRPSDADTAILAGLDEAEGLGLRVLLHVYDRSSGTNAPWYLDDGDWRITERGIEILALVESHPAVWAIYTLHEPFGSSGYYADADSQRELYAFLRTDPDDDPARPYTTHSLYTDIASLWYPHQSGEVMSDGMCDYCGTFPTTFRGEWTSEECLAETFSRIDNDRVVQAQFMPNSELVFLVNTYTLGDGERYRMPTSTELGVVRDYMCTGGNSHLYYPWSGYDVSLDDVPELWPVIAEGCDGVPSVTSTPTPSPGSTDTPTPTGTFIPTFTPTPTSTPFFSTLTPTPGPGGTIIIDHNSVDAESIPQAWLDQARGLVTFFNHKSIGNNILDGIGDLEAQDPGRYGIEVRFGSGVGSGFNHYQSGGNGSPLSKISGFSGLVNPGHDVAMMKFCTGDVPCVQGDTPIETMWVEYRDAMVGLAAGYPDTTMVWWTIPIIASDHSRAHCNEEMIWFNEQVRVYVEEDGGVLFDMADIESHDPDGNPVTWNGFEAGWPGWTSDGAHLNEGGRQRVASAVWWLLARVAGWEG